MAFKTSYHSVLDERVIVLDVLDDMDGVLDDVLYYIREGGRPCSKSSTISQGGVLEGGLGKGCQGRVGIMSVPDITQRHLIWPEPYVG